MLEGFQAPPPLVIEGFQPETILALFKPTTLVQLGLLHPTWVDMNKANTLPKPIKAYYNFVTDYNLHKCFLRLNMEKTTFSSLPRPKAISHNPCPVDPK